MVQNKMIVTQSVKLCLERQGFFGCVDDENRVSKNCLSMKGFDKQLRHCKNVQKHLSNFQRDASIRKPQDSTTVESFKKEPGSIGTPFGTLFGTPFGT
jgi:hypothetical protein